MLRPLPVETMKCLFNGIAASQTPIKLPLKPSSPGTRDAGARPPLNPHVRHTPSCAPDTKRARLLPHAESNHI